MRKLIALLLPILLLAGCDGSPPEEDLGDTYHMGTDQQYYFSPIFGHMCESEDSYYCLQNNWYLYMKDKETGETAIMCNKPDCLHDKEDDYARQMECNAYFIGCWAVNYYQGKLYVHALVDGENIGENYSVVYEMDTSGSTRKEIYRSKEQIDAMIVHRGYLYLSFSDFKLFDSTYEENPELLEGCKCEVVRVPINNPSQKPEIIWEETEKPCQINAMFAYGNRIYMLITSDEVPGFQVYNIQDKSVYVPEISITGSSIPVVGDHLVGATEGLPPDKKVYQTDLDGNVEKELDLPSMGTMLCNGTYLVSDNKLDISIDQAEPEDRAIRIYDTDYKFIREINLGEDALSPIGINEQYYFYEKVGEGDVYDIWAVDLTRLDEKDLQGELFLSGESS